MGLFSGEPCSVYSSEYAELFTLQVCLQIIIVSLVILHEIYYQIQGTSLRSNYVVNVVPSSTIRYTTSTTK